MDAGLPVRISTPPLRRHGRARVPGAGPLADDAADGVAPDPHGRARPWVQQRQHLRESLAPRDGGTDRGERAGVALLRAGVEGERRRPGAPLDVVARRRLHSLLQWPAFALRRYDAIASCARARVPARPVA